MLVIKLFKNEVSEAGVKIQARLPGLPGLWPLGPGPGAPDPRRWHACFCFFTGV